MNTLDIIILIVFVLPAIIVGLMKGFVYQAVTLIAIVVGGWLGTCFATPVGGWLAGFIKDAPEAALKICGFILVFTVAFAAICLLGKLLQKLCTGLFGVIPDKILGLVLALFKSALLAGLLIFLFDAINYKTGLVGKNTLDSSILYGHLKSFAETIFPYLQQIITGVKSL